MGLKEKPKFHQVSSDLFSLKDVPEIDSKLAKVHIPWSYRVYNPESARQLQRLYSKIRFQESSFSNKMWLLLTGEAPNVVMPWIMNGDNLADAMLDMFNAHALTQARGIFGRNVERLSVLTVFGDTRQDLPSKKDIPREIMAKLTPEEQEEVREMAVVLAQASWSEALATLMKYTTRVDTHVTIDGHSYPASEQFKAVGIETINITTAKLMIENLRKNGYLKDNLDTMIVGVDFGNLALAKKLSDEEGFSLGIIHKHRIPNLSGGPSKTEHELVYGDVRGKRVILMDDMIGSGGTISETIKKLLQYGAAEIIVCASHAVFAGREYYEQLQGVLLNDKVKIVMLTDTLPLDRPERGGDKDKPYVFVTNERGRRERREVEMMEVKNFIAYAVGIMLANPSTDEIKKAMGVHVLPQVDPIDLYYQITNKKVPRPKVAAAYSEGGKFETLAEVMLRRFRARTKAILSKKKTR